MTNSTRFRDWLIPCALMLQGVVALSPILFAAGIHGKYIYAAVYAVSLYALLYERRKIPRIGVQIILATGFAWCLAAFHWQELKIALLSYFFVGSVLIAGVAGREDVRRFISLCTLFMFIMVACSWIGFLYVVHGGEALFSILNPDGRENLFYLTTFSNWRVVDSIRASGVFDEAPALSFLICLLTALRRIHGRDERTSLALLLLGLVTFSITHILFLTVFILFRADCTMKRNLRVLLTVAAGVMLVYFFWLKEPVDNALTWRLQYEPKARTIAGDNRTVPVKQTLTRMTGPSFLWGFDSTGYTDVNKFCKRHGDITACPTGPLAMTGIVGSFPYYFFLFWLGWHGIRRRQNMVYLTVVLLFLPRPFVMSYGYAVWAMLILFSIGRTRSEG